MEEPNDKLLDELLGKLEAATKRREGRIARDTEEGIDINAFVEEFAVKKWEHGKLKFYVCQNPEFKHYNGYVRFPERPVKEEGYKGILTYVPVHGGITWARPSPDGSMVYGFDCNHVSDMLPHDLKQAYEQFQKTKDVRALRPKVKKRPLPWLTQQCEIMAAGIRCAARIEEDYLKAGSPEARAPILDQFHKYLRAEGLGEFNLTDNTLAMLNLLSGNL